MNTITRPIHAAILTNIGRAVLAAFADCHGSESSRNLGMSTRNLRFRAPGSTSVSDAMEIMSVACDGYNDFRPELLALLPADAQVTIAREGSVAIYVKGNPFNIPGHLINDYSANAAANPQFQASEISYDAEKDETRLWFD